jgi:hypothetical protein
MTAPHEAGRAGPGGKLAPDHVSLACCEPSRRRPPTRRLAKTQVAFSASGYARRGSGNRAEGGRRQTGPGSQKTPGPVP